MPNILAKILIGLCQSAAQSRTRCIFYKFSAVMVIALTSRMLEVPFVTLYTAMFTCIGRPTRLWACEYISSGLFSVQRMWHVAMRSNLTCKEVITKCRHTRIATWISVDEVQLRACLPGFEVRRRRLTPQVILNIALDNPVLQVMLNMFMMAVARFFNFYTRYQSSQHWTNASVKAFVLHITASHSSTASHYFIDFRKRRIEVL